MMKRLLFLAVAFTLLASFAHAQKMTVESFVDDPMDLAARHYERRDLNNKLCALVKVRLVEPNAVFEGNVMGGIENKTSEYWVYMLHNSRFLRIKCQGYLPLEVNFADYGISQLSGGSTYILTILSGAPAQAQATQPAAPQGGFLVMKVSPTLSNIYINDEMQPAVADGEFKKYLSNGTYRYRVEAGGFSSESGTFTVSGERVNLSVSLRSSKARVRIESSTSGGVIYVDEERMGTGSWSGELMPGPHLVEVRKASHVPYTCQLTLREHEERTLSVPPLEAMYGSLLVDYSPVDAEVYIDGHKLGTSPNVFGNILAGSHDVRISKSGYSDHVQKVSIEHNVQSSLSGSLKKGLSASNGIRPSKEISDPVIRRLIENMVRVEGGTFTMGATAEQGSEAESNEMPAHRVTLSDYYIGRYEVTQEEWEAVMGSNPSVFKGVKLPVEKVTWNDCQEFIKRLNQLTGLRFRLPTEAEWEYAARGGRKSRGYKHSGSNDIDAVAWYKVNCFDKGWSHPDYGTHPVGQKRTNELGLYDMSGNVGEWCQDWYGSYSSSSQTNPVGPSSGSNRVYRGGSWDYSAGLCRVSIRDCSTPSGSDYDLGLRLAL